MSTSNWLEPVEIKNTSPFVKVPYFHDKLKEHEPSMRIIETVAKGEVPEALPVYKFDKAEGFLVSTSLHQALCDLGYFARITKEVAREMKRQLPNNAVILDPLAGKGWNAKAFREVGIPTIATDNNEWGLGHDSIEELDALESLEKYGSEITHLLIAWAPYGSTIDYELLMLAREKFPHVSIINIGESDGCTGSHEFMNAVLETEYYADVPYRNVAGLNDYVSFVS